MAKRNPANLLAYQKVIRQILTERAHECEQCKRYIAEPRYHNFDHIKGRRTKELLLDKNNIRILCYECHYQKTNPGNKVNNTEWLDY